VDASAAILSGVVPDGGRAVQRERAATVVADAAAFICAIAPHDDITQCQVTTIPDTTATTVLLDPTTDRQASHGEGANGSNVQVPDDGPAHPSRVHAPDDEVVPDDCIAAGALDGKMVTRRGSLGRPREAPIGLAAVHVLDRAGGRLSSRWAGSERQDEDERHGRCDEMSASAFRVRVHRYGDSKKQSSGVLL